MRLCILHLGTPHASCWRLAVKGESVALACLLRSGPTGATLLLSRNCNHWAPARPPPSVACVKHQVPSHRQAFDEDDDK